MHQVGGCSNHLMHKSAVASMGNCKHQLYVGTNIFLQAGKADIRRSSHRRTSKKMEDLRRNGEGEREREAGLYVRVCCIIHKEGIKTAAGVAQRWKRFTMRLEKWLTFRRKSSRETMQDKW